MATIERIICTGCRANNRVPKERLEDSPRCGRCHQPLFSGRPLELTDANFQQFAAGGLPLLVMFWAPWCGYCQKSLPDFQQAAQKLEPALRLATLDTESQTFSGRRATINSLPTFVLYKHGREMARQPGALNAAQIIAWARAQLN